MMKKTLLKSIMGIALLGAAVAANATVCSSPCDLTNSATVNPTLTPGETGLIPNTVVGDSPISTDWYFTLPSSLGIGGAGIANNYTVPPAGNFDITGLSVTLYNAVSDTAVAGVLYFNGHTQFSDSSLAAGTYYMQVTGTADGTLGGEYFGSASVSSVPLPAAAWLLLSGLAGMGAMARRRKSEQSA
jgi:hypothetical protein